MPRRIVFAAVFFFAIAAFGGEPGTVVLKPDMVGKITEAILASKVDSLTPRVTREGGQQF